MMPFILGTDMTFPSPELALTEPDGLLAIGGDLSTERLLQAYQQGIFPWFAEEPILWWSPNPRAILLLSDFHVSHSLQKILNKQDFEIQFDTDFRAVIEACAAPRTYLKKSEQEQEQEQGTWITSTMIEAYCTLHDLGYAHSVEVYRSGALIGGLYGISMGRNFAAESMFSLQPNASKIALYSLVQKLQPWGFEFIDCQVLSPHLETLGVSTLPRSAFLAKLAANQVFNLDALWKK